MKFSMNTLNMHSRRRDVDGLTTRTRGAALLLTPITPYLARSERAIACHLRKAHVAYMKKVEMPAGKIALVPRKTVIHISTHRARRILAWQRSRTYQNKQKILPFSFFMTLSEAGNS